MRANIFLSRPYMVLVSPPVGPEGEALLPLPIPQLCDSRRGSTCDQTVHAQWGFVDPRTGEIVVSNGLRFAL